MWSAWPLAVAAEEEKIRADERAKLAEALRRAALLSESGLTKRHSAEHVAIVAGGIEICRHFADKLDQVTANGGTLDV